MQFRQNQMNAYKLCEFNTQQQVRQTKMRHRTLFSNMGQCEFPREKWFH